MSELIDHTYALETIGKFPKGEWFMPTNNNSTNDYLACHQLYEAGLCECKRDPIIQHNKFRGFNVSFKY